MTPHSRPSSILIVDDHHDGVQVLARLLERQGFVVVAAANCEEALQAARGVQFNLLITDLPLPDGDGCHLLRDVRALYPVPAIALTGFALPDERAGFEQAGFDALLLKPVPMEALEKAIEQVLTPARSQAASALAS